MSQEIESSKLNYSRKYRVIIPNVIKRFLESQGDWEPGNMEEMPDGTVVYYLNNCPMQFDSMNKITALSGSQYFVVPDKKWKDAWIKAYEEAKMVWNVVPKSPGKMTAMKFVNINLNEVDAFLEPTPWRIEQRKKGRYDLISTNGAIEVIDILNSWLVKGEDSQVRVFTEEAFKENFIKSPKK